MDEKQNVAQQAVSNVTSVASQSIEQLNAKLEMLQNSKTGKILPLLISAAALIVALLALILVLACGGNDHAFEFQKSPEDTAKNLFANEVKGQQTRSGEEGYFWHKFGGDAVCDAEYEVLEEKDGDGDWAVVTMKTKLNGKTVTRQYIMKKNKDGYYISAADDFEKADKDFVKEASKKISDSVKDNEERSIKYQNID